MSSRPSPRWSAMPSETSRARTIMPAHVASVARPPAIARLSGSNKPIRSISIVMVVLSPPGSTMPSRPSRSWGDRTNRVLAPLASSARMCSANAPCIARTPMRGALREGSVLPASGSEQLFFGDGRNLESVHCLPQAGGYLSEDLRLVEICRGRHDRLGSLQGVLGLKDAGPDEDAIDTELHHRRGVGRRGDPTGSEVDHWQATELLAFGKQVDRRAQQLGLMHELSAVHSDQLADACVDGPGVADGFDHVAGPGLALGAAHPGALRDAAEGLPEIPAPADEGNFERVLVDVIFLVGRSQHL